MEAAKQDSAASESREARSMELIMIPLIRVRAEKRLDLSLQTGRKGVEKGTGSGVEKGTDAFSGFGWKFVGPREFPYLEGMTVELRPETERRAAKRLPKAA